MKKSSPPADPGARRGQASKTENAAPQPADGDGYPARLKHGMAHPQQLYERVPGLHAPCGAAGDEQAPQVLQGPAPARGAGPAAAAVYRDSVSGQTVVPSGRVMLRFAQGINAADRAADVQAAGYRIVQVLAYAPQAAWLESVPADVALALSNLDRLEALPGVENVEPQWLSPRSLR